MLHLSGIFRALEHHVLEQMRETAAAARLKTKADLIIDADGDDGRGTVRRCDHAQAVRERGVLDGNVKLLRCWIQRLPPRDCRQLPWTDSAALKTVALHLNLQRSLNARLIFGHGRRILREDAGGQKRQRGVRIAEIRAGTGEAPARAGRRWHNRRATAAQSKRRAARSALYYRRFAAIKGNSVCMARLRVKPMRMSSRAPASISGIRAAGGQHGRCVIGGLVARC